MLNLIFKNYKKYHENQRKKLRRLIYISSKSNFDAQTLLWFEIELTRRTVILNKLYLIFLWLITDDSFNSAACSRCGS